MVIVISLQHIQYKDIKMTFTTKKVIQTNALDPSVTELRTYRSTFNGSVLLISLVTKDENDQEIEQLTMEQPWKCYTDGSRAPFVDENDAQMWLESVKHTFL